MAVYVFQETEPFAVIFERMREAGTSIDAQAEVRRPVRGLQAERDTYAYLKVVDVNGAELPFVNSGASVDYDGIGYSWAYSNFLLQKVQIQRAELKQFVKTFGTIYLFLFGEHPVMVSVEGALVKSADFRWDEEWWVNYESMLRATRLAEKGARAYLSYDGVLIEGYILNATTSRDAMNRHLVPLGFEMVATDVKYLAKVGKVEFPVDKTRFRNPGTWRGYSLNQELPMAFRMSYDRQSVGALLESAFSGDVIAKFGSFAEMVTTLHSNPELLIGLADTASGVAATMIDAAMDKPAQPARPVYGNININYDEYVTGLKRDLSTAAEFPQSRLQAWHESVTPSQDQQMGGEAARRVTQADDTYNAYSPPANAVNMSAIEGCSGACGTGVIPGVNLRPFPDHGDLSTGNQPRLW